MFRPSSMPAEPAESPVEESGPSLGRKPATKAEPVSVSSYPPPQGDGSLLWRLGGIAKTIRPHQWVKNVFVLAPVVFAKEIFDPALLTRAASAFAVFCLVAGAVYAMNDIADVESDRKHPVKRHRPIASGRVPIPVARGLAAVLVIAALGWGASLSLEFLAVAATYFVLNLAYSLKLKHVAYLDVSCLALFFVLRVMGGGFASQVYVSRYLFLCTALLALFLGFGKRRHELAAAAGKAALQRAALESYTKRGLDWALGGTAVATIATYVVYTLDPDTRSFFNTDWLWVSSVFVMLGVFRFLQLVSSRPKSESPTQEMLKDGPFVAIVLIWVVLVMWVVYNLRPAA